MFRGAGSSAVAAAADVSLNEMGKADFDTYVSAGGGNKTQTKASSRLVFTSKSKSRLMFSDLCDVIKNEVLSEPDADARPGESSYS